MKGFNKVKMEHFDLIRLFFLFKGTPILKMFLY